MTTLERYERGELQAWYVGSLHPKLTAAADAGTVAPAAVAELDRLLRDFLDLSGESVEQGA